MPEWKIPGADCRHHAHWLLHGDHAHVLVRCFQHIPTNPPTLLSKPFYRCSAAEEKCKDQLSSAPLTLWLESVTNIDWACPSTSAPALSNPVSVQSQL